MPTVLDWGMDQRLTPIAQQPQRSTSSFQNPLAYPPAPSQQQHQISRSVTPLVEPSPHYHESLYENSYIRRLSVDLIDAMVSRSPSLTPGSQAQAHDQQQQQQQHHVTFHPHPLLYGPPSTEGMVIFPSHSISRLSGFGQPSVAPSPEFVDVPPSAVNPESVPSYFDAHRHQRYSWDGGSWVNASSSHADTTPRKSYDSAPTHFTSQEW